MFIKPDNTFAPDLPAPDAAPGAFARVQTLLADIDDTLTTNGRLTAQAYDALERLERGGVRSILLTGRPAGWCDMIARFWPVAGIVGENGAFAFRYDRQARRMIRLYSCTDEERAERRMRLDALAPVILAEVPGAAISADQPYRIADLAIDFREDVAPLDTAAINKIAAIFERHGAAAKISSIHVNGWFGAYDKLTMAKRFLAEGIGAPFTQDECAFIGDSPNDEPLFAALSLGVGVANVRAFLGHMKARPHFITASEGGQGFAEFADFLLAARAGSAGA